MFPRLGLTRMVSFLALLLLRVVSLDRRPEWLSCYTTSFTISPPLPSSRLPVVLYFFCFLPSSCATAQQFQLNRCAVAQHLALDLRSPKAANFFASCFDDRALGFSIFFLSGRASASFSRRTRWWARCLPPFFASRPLMGASAACVPLARLLLLLPVRVATREGPFSTSSTRNQTAVGVQNSPTRPLLRVRPTLR